MDRSEKWQAVNEKDFANFGWKTVIQLDLSAGTHCWEQRGKGKLRGSIAVLETAV